MKNKKKIKCGIFWILFLFLFILSPVYADTEVHFLDVGQGLSILVKSNDEYMIYDGGGRSSSSFVVAYLKQQGVKELKYVIASHYDEDHLAGLIGCLNVFQADEVWGPNYIHDTDLYDSFMHAVDGKAINKYQPSVGSKYAIGSAEITILSPENISSNDNDNSVVILLKDDSCSFVFTGDSETEAEYGILNSGLNIDADVLCVGHHGSSKCTTDSFLNAVSPEYAVISCGENNSYGHPHMETLERLNSAGIKIFRTDLKGTIIANTDGNTISWSASPCDESAAKSEEQVVVKEAIGFDYVVNTNTKKFHYPDCKSVNQMKDANRLDYNGSRDELISQGYDPCGNCNP